MHRALKDGGTACVSVWESAARCEPFETYIDVLRELGVEPPFPAAYRMESYTMSESDVLAAFTEAGFADVEVRKERLDLSWPDVDAAVAGLKGTPFGPVVAKLEPEKRQEVIDAIRERFSDNENGPVVRTTESVFAHGTAHR
jgi:hypothetical protein